MEITGNFVMLFSRNIKLTLWYNKKSLGYMQYFYLNKIRIWSGNKLFSIRLKSNQISTTFKKILFFISTICEFVYRRRRETNFTMFKSRIETLNFSHVSPISIDIAKVKLPRCQHLSEIIIWLPRRPRIRTFFGRHSFIKAKILKYIF